MKANVITNIVGAVGAAATAAQPVLHAAGGGSLHQNDYFQLITAIAIAVIGWFTGKNQAAQ